MELRFDKKSNRSAMSESVKLSDLMLKVKM